MRWLRPRSEWARLAGTLAAMVPFGLALWLPGWVWAHVSDAIDAIRAALS